MIVVSMIHMIPADDLIAHEPFGTTCVCGPAVRFTFLGITMVHFSLDGREFVPEAIEEQEPDHGGA